MIKFFTHFLFGLMCITPFLALGMLIAVSIMLPGFGILMGLVLLLHVPIFCGLIWGSEETKQTIYNYHPPGHE